MQFIRNIYIGIHVKKNAPCDKNEKIVQCTQCLISGVLKLV